jgi:hypothetical protein
MHNKISLKKNSAYNIYEDILPHKISPFTKIFLFKINNFLHEKRPKNIYSMVLYTDISWSYNHSKLIFYTFGNFRSTFKIIHRTSKLLAHLYLEYSILAIITPITQKELSLQIQYDGDILKNISKKGILTYFERDFKNEFDKRLH